MVTPPITHAHQPRFVRNRLEESTSRSIFSVASSAAAVVPAAAPAVGSSGRGDVVSSLTAGRRPLLRSTSQLPGAGGRLRFPASGVLLDELSDIEGDVIGVLEQCLGQSVG